MTQTDAGTKNPFFSCYKQILDPESNEVGTSFVYRYVSVRDKRGSSGKLVDTF